VCERGRDQDKEGCKERGGERKTKKGVGERERNGGEKEGDIKGGREKERKGWR
jgi:hypothetical protein